MAELFPRELVDALAVLRLVVGPTAPAGTHGEHRAAARGAGFDFRDFQAYSPGDELRRVDWNIYRRSGHLFLRRYDQLQTIPVYVLIDVSRSMFFEEPSRYAAAARVAAAVAAAALRLHDTVDIVPLADGDTPSLRRISGRSRLPAVLDYLRSQKPAETIDRNASLSRFAASSRRRGLAVVISDFFDESGLEAVLRPLEMIQHRLLLVRITQPTDADPLLDGELVLVDCETGTPRPVAPTAAVLSAYRTAYAAFVKGLADHAQKRGAMCLAVDASRSPLEQIGAVFPGGVLRT